MIEVPKVTLSTLRTYIDALIDYSTCSQLPEMAHQYGNLRMIRKLIIKEQHMEGCQTKSAASLVLVVLFKMVLLLVIPYLSWAHLLTLKIELMLTHVVDSFSIVSSHNLITPGDDVQDADRPELMVISDSD